MTGILADVNIQGHVDYLFRLLTSDDWGEFWQALGIRYVTFRDIGLNAEAPDAVVWQTCQDQELVLVTSNRNQRGVILRASTSHVRRNRSEPNHISFSSGVYLPEVTGSGAPKVSPLALNPPPSTSTKMGFERAIGMSRA